MTHSDPRARVYRSASAPIGDNLMPSYATATITGHITQPEHRYTPTGTMIATFSLPVNEREMKGGEWVDAPTTWWRCTAFGKLAERIVGYDKGTLATVIGRAKLRPWTGQDGSERQSLEIVVSEFQFLSRPRSAEGAPTGDTSELQRSRQNNEPIRDEVDLPF